MYKMKILISRRNIILYVLLTVLIVFGVVAVYVSINKNNQYVATVNGESVSVHEVKRIIASECAGIYNYFKEKYNVDDSKNFWTSSYNGESTIDMLRENVMKKLIRIKIQQILAREKGIIQDIGYPEFIRALEHENRRRAEAVKNKQAIFGLVKFTERAFFDKTFGEMVFQLKEKIKKESSIGENKLKEYYEANKDKLFKKLDKIKIQKISVPYSSKYKTKKEDSEYRIMEIKARLNKVEDFEEISELYSKDSSIKIEFSEQVFDDSTARSDYKKWPELALMAGNLPEGEVSDIFEENESFYIIKCIERSDSGYKSLDEVKNDVESLIADDEYEKMIDKLVSEAKVDINEKVYEKIKP